MSGPVLVQSLANVTERKLPFTDDEAHGILLLARGSLAREFWDLISRYGDGLTDPITKKPFPPIEVAERRLVVQRDSAMRATCNFFELRNAIDNLRAGKKVARGLDYNDLCNLLQDSSNTLEEEVQILKQHQRAWDLVREDRLRRLVAALEVHVRIQENLIKGIVEEGWQPSQELVGAVSNEVAELRKKCSPASDWLKAMSFCSLQTKRPYFTLTELPPDDTQTVREDPEHRNPLPGRDVVQRLSDVFDR